MCTDQIWVPCLECTEGNWEDAPDRYAVSENESLTFALRNDCSAAEVANAAVNLGVIAFLAVSLLVMSRVQRRTEIMFDEDEQTAQDYSVMVDDCPPDATNPDGMSVCLSCLVDGFFWGLDVTVIRYHAGRPYITHSLDQLLCLFSLHSTFHAVVCLFGCIMNE